MVGVVEEIDRRSDDPEVRPRRLGRWHRTGVSLGVVIAGALVAGIVWLGANVAYYQPIAWGGGAELATESSIMVRVPGHTAHLIPLEPGEEVVLWVHLYNRGHRTIRVEDLAPTWFPFAYLEYLGPVKKDGSGNEAHGGWPGGQEPFEAFDVHPGQFAVVGSRYRFHECIEVDDSVPPLSERTLGDPQIGSSTTWNGTETLTFTVNGFRRHTTVYFEPAPTIVVNRVEGVEVDPNECPGYVELPWS